MTIPDVCPNPVCRGKLVETAKAHCLDKRKTPCGWIHCKCGTNIDKAGRFNLPPSDGGDR